MRNIESKVDPKEEEKLSQEARNILENWKKWQSEQDILDFFDGVSF